MKEEVEKKDIDKLYDKLNREAETAGYNLNPDKEFTKDLVKGLIVNTRRYGYQSCPCRLAKGKKEADIDIICPCDYRDPDLSEYGACYCALYVSEDIKNGREELTTVPERRGKAKNSKTENISADTVMDLEYPIFRCSVCGYLCARNDPPNVCPICKAKKERFKKFI